MNAIDSDTAIADVFRIMVIKDCCLTDSCSIKLPVSKPEEVGDILKSKTISDFVLKFNILLYEITCLYGLQCNDMVDPKVLEAMIPYFCEIFGNASSSNHKFSWDAEEAVSRRKQVADLIGARPSEIIFTAGLYWSNNISIKELQKFIPKREITL